MKKKRMLRFRKTALTLLSAGMVSSMMMGHAAQMPPDAALHRLYFASQAAKDTLDMIADERSRKKPVRAKEGTDELLAGIIGRNTEYIKKERFQGKSPEEIAAEFDAAEEFRAAMMRKRNDRLTELLNSGRISKEEFAQMYDNTDFVAVPFYEKANRLAQGKDDGGDAAALLAEVLDATPEEIEAQIMRGETPWEIAQNGGRLEEYKEAVLERLFSALEGQVSGGMMTREEADERIADFEFDFAAFPQARKSPPPGF